jgi:hypothetical protein
MTERKNATENQTGRETIVATHEDKSRLLSIKQTAQLYAASANAPAIIDRASTAAKEAPFCETVRRSVAKAIEGAAAKRPAKVFGRSKSPRVANAETATPPATKRRRYSIIPSLRMLSSNTALKL